MTPFQIWRRQDISDARMVRLSPLPRPCPCHECIDRRGVVGAPAAKYAIMGYRDGDPIPPFMVCWVCAQSLGYAIEEAK